MHDTLLIEKIYKALTEISQISSIIKINKLKVEVDEGSHISAPLLLAHLKARNGRLFGDWTEILIETKPYNKLTAIITGIEGERA